jgi:hypothetical protein
MQYFQFSNAAGTDRSRRCYVERNDTLPGITSMQVFYDMHHHFKGPFPMDPSTLPTEVRLATECVNMIDDTPWTVVPYAPRIVSRRLRELFDKFGCACHYVPCRIVSLKSTEVYEYWCMAVMTELDCADYGKSYDVRPKHVDTPCFMEPVIERDKVPIGTPMFRIRHAFDWIYVSSELADALRAIRSRGTLLRRVECV